MATSKKYLMAAAGAAGGAGGDYWIITSGGTASDILQGVTTDSSDNIIAVGNTRSDALGNNDSVVSKYDSTGALLWQRILGATGIDDYYSVDIDSSDNIIVAGRTDSNSAGGVDALISKYNSSGTLQWQRILGGTGTDTFRGVKVDSNDNIVVAGFTNSDGAGNQDFLIAKYNSSGTLQWDRTLGGANVEIGYGVAVDSSDNIIIAGYTSSVGVGNYDAFVAKYNSSGTLQWDRTLGGTLNNENYAVTVDSSNNIITVGYTNSDGAGNDDVLIAKYNSSGTLQWDRTLGGTGDEVGLGVTVDSSDNIILTGRTASDGEGGNDILIAKYNSSGTLQWDRTLGGTGNEVGLGVTVDSSDNIIVAGFTASDGAGNNDFIIAKLPSDGSLEGTYGAFTYADAVLTDDPAVLTDASASLTDAAAVLTDATPTLTEIKRYTLYTIS